MNTDHANIERLLERFFEGQSTLEEEAELTAYFARDDVPMEWLQYKKVFQYLETLQPEHDRRRDKWLTWMLRCGAAAAIIAILSVVGIRLLNNTHEAVVDETRVAIVHPDATSLLAPEDTVTDAPSKSDAVVAPKMAHNKPRVKARAAATSTASTKTDSAEIVHTEGELEKAEQEYIADRLLLQQELRRNLSASVERSGWITTSLNIQ